MYQQTKTKRSRANRFIAIFLGAMVLSTLSAWAGQTHRLKVDGLACPFCAYGIEKQLKAIPGVKGVKVSVKTGTVSVIMKDGKKLSKARASQAVANAGFKLRSFR